MKKIFGIFAALLLLVSCSGKVSYKPLKDIPVKPNFNVEFPSDDSLRLTMDFSQTRKAGKNKASFLEMVSSINSVIYANDSRLDSISVSDFNVNSVAFGSNSISTNLVAVLPWKKPGYINSNLLNFNIQVITPKVIYTGLLNLQQIASNAESKAPQRAVTLYPSVSYTADSTFDFTVTSKRNFVDEKEYIPNSEEMRLEILNSRGERIYSSNTNISYFQVIKHILPEEIGRTFNYHMFWVKRYDNGDPAPRGKYTARLTIPSRPMPYIVNLDFEY